MKLKCLMVLTICLVGLTGLTGCGKENTPNGSNNHSDNFVAIEVGSETEGMIEEPIESVDGNEQLETNTEEPENIGNGTESDLGVETKTEEYKPEVVFGVYTEPEQTDTETGERSTLADRLTSTSAWIQYSSSEYAADFENFTVTELNGEFECYYSDNYYSIRVDYSDNDGECVVFVNDANDKSIMLARFE